jgi:hypothetical protein
MRPLGPSSIGRFVAIGIAVATFSPTASGQDDAPRRSVRVGVYQNEPKIFRDETGEASGLFADLVSEIAQRESWELKFVSCEWSECLEALQGGRIDLLPDVAFSRERDASIDFHRVPVIESWSQLYSREPIEDISDLHGKTVVVLRAAIQESTFGHMMEGFGLRVEVLPVDSLPEAFRMVQGGSADAAISNHFFGERFHRDYGLVKNPIVFQAVQLYFATAEGRNQDLLKAMDQHLESWQKDPDSPYYQTLSRWMGKKPERFVPGYVRWSIGFALGLLALSAGMILLLRRQVRARTDHLMQAVRDLKESEERYRLIADKTADVIWQMDLEWRFVYVNAAVYPVLGYRPDEYVGTRLSDHVEAEDLPVIAKVIMAGLGKASADAMIETRLRHKDGRLIPVEVHGALILDEQGAPHRIQGTTRDVTEQRRISEQLQVSQRLEAVGQLAGGVAHDFNNLLTVINSGADLVLEELGPDDPTRVDLMEIRRAGQRAAVLTRQLLAFSRKQVLEPRLLNMEELARDLLGMLRRLLGEQIRIEVHCGPDLGVVRADPGQIEQVMVNLAVNARDAMPDGGTLSIGLERVALEDRRAELAPGEYLMVSVSDTGIGMDKNTQDHLFEPFFTTKSVGKGTGLGLATVWGIIKQSGGHVEVQSEVGVGTTFRIYLPFAEPDGEGNPSSRPVGSVHPRGRETVLIVEDEEGVLRLAARILRHAGYRVITAADGEEALRICERESGLDLLLTDVIMPQMSAKELVSRVLVAVPEIQVLYMSGHMEELIASQGVFDSRHHFIPKPFSASELTRKVRDVLDEASS